MADTYFYLKTEKYTTWLRESSGSDDMRKDEARSVVKIVQCLEQAEGSWLWYREIGRRTKMQHTTVSRLILKYLGQFVDIQTTEPFKAKMVKLKPGVDTKAVVRYLAIQEKLGKL